jgi:hypothetical protein
MIDADIYEAFNALRDSLLSELRRVGEPWERMKRVLNLLSTDMEGDDIKSWNDSISVWKAKGWKPKRTRKRTLKELYKKHNIPPNIPRCERYEALVADIIEDNKRELERKVQEISDDKFRKYKVRGKDLQLVSIIGLPTVRKSAESGKEITWQIRNKLTRGLRKALNDNPIDMEAAIEAMRQVVLTEPAISPNKAKMIGITETRSAIDLMRYEYAKRYAQLNHVALVKKWIHNDHLVKKFRKHHKELDGMVVGLHDTFPVMTLSGHVYQAQHPHAPGLPAGEVINCQCSYEIIPKRSMK